MTTPKKEKKVVESYNIEERISKKIPEIAAAENRSESYVANEILSRVLFPKRKHSKNNTNK